MGRREAGPWPGLGIAKREGGKVPALEGVEGAEILSPTSSILVAHVRFQFFPKSQKPILVEAHM